MPTSTIYEMYFDDASDFYDQHLDPEYEHCHDNHYRFFLIKEYAEWLSEMNEVIRIWE
jgi:hypothetical protein